MIYVCNKKSKILCSETAVSRSPHFSAYAVTNIYTEAMPPKKYNTYHIRLFEIA